MSRLLQFILSGQRSVDEARAKIQEGYSKIPLFEKLAGLNNNSLYDHLFLYQKVRGFGLVEFCQAGAINIEEKNQFGQTLLQRCIVNNDINSVRFILSLGAQLSEVDFALCPSIEMINFFNYRPGTNQPSIFEFCIRRRNAAYLEKVNALIFDEANSTNESSSDSEALSSESLNEEEKNQLNRLRTTAIGFYNRQPRINFLGASLCLVAARGVHFSPQFFNTEIIEQVKESRHLPQTTYSQSTLFDAGYEADDSPEEDDEAIVARHNINNYFVEQLKVTADFKEKKIGAYTPPKTRNDREFDSAYYRFMQVYINSYDTMFNKGSIRSDFHFDTLKNPLVSASWKMDKGGMYGNGARISPANRRDPHYRRFTSKPKHPNMGYLDLFTFDVNYARTQGFDRTLECEKGNIDLKNLFLYEAEVIFNSMIPKRYHEHRHILTIPSFELAFEQNKAYYKRYGIISNTTYKKFKNNLLSNPKHSKEYHDTIKEISEKAGEAQAKTIKNSLDCRLFRMEKPKIAVFDHGNKLETTPFTI